MFDTENTSLVMSLPTLIKGSYIPKDNYPCHQPAIVSEKDDMALLGFIKLGLNEQETCDFYEDFFRDWARPASPAMEGDHVDTTLTLPATPLT